MKRVLAIAVGAAVLGGLAGAVIGLALDNGDTASAAPAGTVQAVPSSTAPAPGGMTPEQIYAQDASSVVVITDTQTQQTPPSVFGPGQAEQVRALGSGFVIDDHGDIVTNAHVVANATSVRVGFNGGASFKATLVGADPSTDIAVVRVSARPRPSIRSPSQTRAAFAWATPSMRSATPSGSIGR